jgi:hypothetical protein
LTNLCTDSLVSSQVYEIIRTVYSTTANETTEEGRIKVLQSTLGQLRLNNIATLDAIMTHFTRLLDLTSADDAYVSTLTTVLSPCILRPRIESTLTMNERNSQRLIRDLFDHKETIFGELKRQSSTNVLGAGSGTARPRAISTDESHRRAAMEARNRAIANRSRATSPAPSARHRRDISSDGSGGRFPINVSSPPGVERRKQVRPSLDVPEENEHVAETEQRAETGANGTTVEDGSPPPTATSASESAGPDEKRDSINRGRRVGGSHTHTNDAADDSAAIAASLPPDFDLKGVTLDDKPMDDFA